MIHVGSQYRAIENRLFQDNKISPVRGDIFNQEKLFHADLACVAGVAIKFDGNCQDAKYQCIPKPCKRAHIEES